MDSTRHSGGCDWPAAGGIPLAGFGTEARDQGQPGEADGRTEKADRVDQLLMPSPLPKPDGPALQWGSRGAASMGADLFREAAPSPIREAPNEGELRPAFMAGGGSNGPLGQSDEVFFQGAAPAPSPRFSGFGFRASAVLRWPWSLPFGPSPQAPDTLFPPLLTQVRVV